MGKTEGRDGQYLQNRELSLLTFYGRLLEEGGDDSVPLWERLRFLKIFTENLDEIFMVRVGRLLGQMDEKKVGNDCAVDSFGGWALQQLNRICAAVLPLLQQRASLHLELERQLAFRGVEHCSPSALSVVEKQWLSEYVQQFVLPLLSPQKVDKTNPFPHIPGKMPFLAVSLSKKGNRSYQICILPKTLPTMVSIPGENVRYCRMEEILLWRTGELFRGFKVLEKGFFMITRSADLPFCRSGYPSNQEPRSAMNEALRRREWLPPVRLQSEGSLSAEFLSLFCQTLSLSANQVFVTQSPLRYAYLDELEEEIPRRLLDKLKYPSFLPQPSREISLKRSILRQIMEQDLLLHYPYESMEPFLQLIREAALDSAVRSIQITLYRVAHSSRLLQYLMMAAQEGKEVRVYVELRARFDEKNNLYWSEQLQNAGCQVIHPIGAQKLHAKLCLITRMSAEGARYVTQIGTGNYHEDTVKQYTDFCLLTARPEIGADAARFFDSLKEGKLPQHCQTLLVSPGELRRKLSEAIDRQITKGREGRLLFQMNSLSDDRMIRKLVEAAQKGVEVRLIVRGVCRLFPGMPQTTDRILITSIAGRFLEHARIYSFGRSLDTMELYIGSADLMPRNLDRRIEVLTPVLSPALRERILQILTLRCCDGVKAREWTPQGKLVRPLRTGFLALDSQEACIALSKKKQKRNGQPIRRFPTERPTML